VGHPIVVKHYLAMSQPIHQVLDNYVDGIDISLLNHEDLIEWEHEHVHTLKVELNPLLGWNQLFVHRIAPKKSLHKR
jgi:hypothetical protein